MLTAAHCVSTCVNNGPDIILSQVMVCAWGNAYTGADCVLSAEIAPSPAYDIPNNCGSNLDDADDWALIDLQSAMPSSTTDFDLSTLSLVGSREIRTFGFPAKVPGTCVANTASNVDATVSDATKLFQQNDVEMTNFSGAVAKAKLDSMARQSGAPVYHCGTNDDFCDPGEKGYVDMVLIGFQNTPTTDRMVGPRVPAFRDEFLAEFND